MDSSGHRANILGKTWDVIGIGAYKGPTGKKMWTVLFADKCGSTAPKPTPKPTPGRSRPTPRPTPKPAPKATPRPTPKPARRSRPRRRRPSSAPSPRRAAGRRPRSSPTRRRAGASDAAPSEPTSTPPAISTRPSGCGGRSPDLGWIARNDRRRSGRLLLRRWMMTVATRAPRRATPDPVRPDRDAAHAPTEASSPMPAILEARDLTKSYPLGATVVEALRGVSLTVAGRRVRRADGPVGLGQVHPAPAPRRPRPADRPARSSSRARRSASCPTTEATRLRRDRTGFVFQSFNLIPLLDASENVGAAVHDRRRGPDPGRAAPSASATPSGWST